MQPGAGSVRWPAVRALAVRQWKSGWRSYRFAGVGVFIALTWPFRPPAVALDAIAAPFTLASVAVLLLGAAVIARDYESGGMILDRLHGATPIEVVLGSLLYTIAAGAALAVVLGAELVIVSPRLFTYAGTIMLLAGVLSLVAICALLVAFGAVAPGYANSAIVVGLIVVAPGLGAVQRSGVPQPIAAAFRAVRAALPLPHQVIATGTALTRGDPPVAPILALALGSLAATLAAIVIVQRREPARGWRR